MADDDRLFPVEPPDPTDRRAPREGRDPVDWSKIPGTPLNWPQVVTIFQRGAGAVGSFDKSQRLYQKGGEKDRHTWPHMGTDYHSFGLGEWRQIMALGCERIEFRDKVRRECHAISMVDAEDAAIRLDTQLGPRICVPWEAHDLVWSLPA